MGATKIYDYFPKLLKRVRDEGRNVVWSCDPMHGNIEKSGDGLKTRNFDKILQEVDAFFKIHRDMGTVAGGIHLEMTW